MRSKFGFEVLFTAIGIGLAADYLLRADVWGLNILVFNALFFGSLGAIAWRHRPDLLTKTNVSLAAAILFFASMFVVRADEELLVFDTLAILGLMGVLLLANLKIKAHVAGTFHYIVGVAWSACTSFFGPFFLLGSDIDWKKTPGGASSRTAFAALRGLAIALPLVFIFGALFMSADAAFEASVNRVINIDLSMVAGHVMLTSVFAWLSAGYFRGALKQFGGEPTATEAAGDPTKSEAAIDTADIGSFVDRMTAEAAITDEHIIDSTVVEHINRSDPPAAKEPELFENIVTNPSVPSFKARLDRWQNFDNSKVPAVFTLGAVEIVLLLGLLDLLFISFVSFQIPYLFGGLDLVQATPDFKLSEYARRGFGELVFASALVLPILLASHWLIRSTVKGRAETIFRILAGGQIVLLFVIMASAVQRLVILTGEAGYGLTTVRFYPMVFMTWLAIVFVWFGLTVLRGARNRFAWGALWAAVIVLGATNLVNPHAFIAETNLQLMRQGRDFDAYYNANLSADAIPTILAAMPEMSVDDRCEVQSSIHYDYRLLGRIDDIRSFNFSRNGAYRHLHANDALLHQQEGCPERFLNSASVTGDSE
ncbi:MAG TPA: DUF4173 domain-containing protein [Pyrinomonadaceae bacterium]|nr:DUF4173 domain-containing protein [Pyrinomonadaceae bacterium]